MNEIVGIRGSGLGGTSNSTSSVVLGWIAYGPSALLGSVGKVLNTTDRARKTNFPVSEIVASVCSNIGSPAKGYQLPIRVFRSYWRVYRTPFRSFLEAMESKPSRPAPSASTRAPAYSIV